MDKTNFELVSDMNIAFGNPKGDPANIDHARLTSQYKNIFDEYCEGLLAIGYHPDLVNALKASHKAFIGDMDPTPENFDRDGLRDALIDQHVFGYGAHHFMGIDADYDMHSVIQGNMTRFIKGEDDKDATIAKHAAKGVTDVYFEGEYPTMVMKSASDQPDAPKGKFLKSASYSEPVFYDPVAEQAAEQFDIGMAEAQFVDAGEAYALGNPTTVMGNDQ